MKKLFVIDVSAHQGKIDWEKVKAAGVDAAIIRCGYGTDLAVQDDKFFERNVAECVRLGIPYGVYLYSYANSVAKASSEAKHVLRLLKGKNPRYRVFYDLEDPNTTFKCSKSLIADMAEAFLNEVAAAGYRVGVYASKYWFTSILTDPRFSQWPKWVAQYHTSCTYQGQFVAWQKSSKGKVDGIAGYVDINEFYVDYAADEPIKKPEDLTADKLPDLSGYVGTSIAGALNSVGFPSDYSHRKDLAAKLGIAGYKGTAEQNLDMIKRLGGKVEQEPQIHHDIYRVKPGDNLSKIAKDYKTTVETLMQVNRIPNKNLIYVGQVIYLPS